MKKILRTVVKILGVVFYFATIYFAFTRMKLERLDGDLKAFAGAFFIFGLIAIEEAYRKESGKIAIGAIELMVLAFHSLSINYVIKAYNIDIGKYLIFSGIVFSLYYIIKAIIINIRDKKQELKQISDVSEIVKEEPVKKEAKKKNKKQK